MSNDWPKPDEIRASLAALPEPCEGPRPWDVPEGSVALGVFYSYAGGGDSFHYDYSCAMGAKALVAAIERDMTLLDGDMFAAFDAACALYPGLDDWLGGTTGASLSGSWRAAKHVFEG